MTLTARTDSNPRFSREVETKLADATAFSPSSGTPAAKFLLPPFSGSVWREIFAPLSFSQIRFANSNATRLVIG
jgi:hypothetical protein